jgi:hypothetical protein
MPKLPVKKAGLQLGENMVHYDVVEHALVERAWLASKQEWSPTRHGAPMLLRPPSRAALPLGECSVVHASTVSCAAVMGHICASGLDCAVVGRICARRRGLAVRVPPWCVLVRDCAQC